MIRPALSASIISDIRVRDELSRYIEVDAKETFNSHRRSVLPGAQSQHAFYQGAPQLRGQILYDFSNIRKGVVIGMMNYPASSTNLDGVQ